MSERQMALLSLSLEPRGMCMPVTFELTVVIVVELTISLLTIPSVVYTFFLYTWYVSFMAFPLMGLVINTLLSLLLILAIRRRRQNFVKPYMVWKVTHCLLSLLGISLMWAVGYVRISENLVKSLRPPYPVWVLSGLSAARKFMIGITIYSLIYLLGEICFLVVANEVRRWLRRRDNLLKEKLNTSSICPNCSDTSIFIPTPQHRTENIKSMDDEREPNNCKVPTFTI